MLSKHFDIVSAWVTFSFADFFILFYYHFLLFLFFLPRSYPWSDPIRSDDPIRWSDPMIRSDDPIRDPIQICRRRVMHEILKCSPLIMKNHVLNWCHWCVKLSLLDLLKLFVFFFRWPASGRIETQPSESKRFRLLTWILRDRPSKNWTGENQKNSIQE